MRQEPEIGDGLKAMNRVIDPKEIARLIGELARWVDPEIFRLLPVWHPETARKQALFKAGWQEVQTNNGKPKFEGNSKANAALSRALGISKKARPNWSCCHIWGNDDASFSKGNSEVNDPKYYSCIANMVLLPNPLKAFTDSVPEVKSALRLAAFQLYGFLPQDRSAPTTEDTGEWLPEGWERGMVNGICRINPRIKKSAQSRANKIFDEFNNTAANYPHQQVSRVMRYWSEKIPEFEFGEAS